MNLLQEPLNFRVSSEALRLLLEDVVGPHAAQSEIPDALLVLGAVSRRVEVVRPGVALLLQQFDQEEHRLEILAAEAEILVIAWPFLIIEINMEQLACLKCLCHSMHKVETCHQLVCRFGIETHHLWMVKCVDEAKHVPNGG